ncbi:MAG: GntR family transcriptional regulator [Collinsella sp.]
MADAVKTCRFFTNKFAALRAERIERGDYPTGSMIPSENELAEEFGTTRLTIRSAMDELVKSGQIRRVQGKGAFVGHKWFDEHERKGGFRQSVLASGATPSVRILARSKRYAGPYYADLFGIMGAICFTQVAPPLAASMVSPCR